ncbi:hypothetical protein ACJX0J_012671, partial [Zea mays]
VSFIFNDMKFRIAWNKEGQPNIFCSALHIGLTKGMSNIFANMHECHINLYK